MRKLLSFQIFVLILLITVNSCTEKKDEKEISIVTPPNIIASLPHWVAKEKEMYKEENISVNTVDIDDSATMINSLIEGSADVLPAVSMLDVVNGRARNVPNKPIVYSHSRMRKNPEFESLVVMSGSEISSLGDLEGSSIAVYPGNTSKKATKNYLRKNGVNVSKVRFVELPPPEHERALVRGDVQASHLYEPHRTRVMISGQCRKLSGSIYAELSNPSAIGASAISSKFKRKREKALKRYLSVWNKSVDFIRNNKREARKILSKKMEISEEVAMNATWVDVTKTKETSEKVIKETIRGLKKIGVVRDELELNQTYLDSATIDD